MSEFVEDEPKLHRIVKLSGGEISKHRWRWFYITFPPYEVDEEENDDE